MSHRTLNSLQAGTTPKTPRLLSYDLGIRALPLLIERAAQVIEPVELGRLSRELATVTTGEYSIHFRDKRAGANRELHTAAEGVQV